ncbi:hypothetical protein Nepgr_031791 [Nepenthes gracilis]|uniref:Uncharacterized protein n=1 Tax=Nepenthes gracilis TaxID=150966 RepID=A0AAD3TJB6_NEPGR|nr:hypothetical protein Nepgr_031791 [Nepenthes gracilis]
MPSQLRIKTRSSSKLPDQMFTDILIKYQWKPKCNHMSACVRSSEIHPKTAAIFKPTGKILPNVIPPPLCKVTKSRHNSDASSKVVPVKEVLSVSNSFATLQECEMESKYQDNSEIILSDEMKDELLQINPALYIPNLDHPGVDDRQFPRNKNIGQKCEAVVISCEMTGITKSPLLIVSGHPNGGIIAHPPIEMQCSMVALPLSGHPIRVPTTIRSNPNHGFEVSDRPTVPLPPSSPDEGSTPALGASDKSTPALSAPDKSNPANYGARSIKCKCTPEMTINTLRL